MKKTIEQRFWEKVDRKGPEECWPWTRGRNSDGYGTFYSNGKPVGAHCASFQMATGRSTSGYHVCHSCDNPGCVNPAHLWLGTVVDNMRDKSAKGRYISAQKAKTHCWRGHEFSADNTYRYKAMRVCKICRMIRVNKYRQKTRHRIPLVGMEGRCPS